MDLGVSPISVSTDVCSGCVAVQVPENGYLTDSAYGSGWQCERGYRAINEICVAIRVPESGYLADAGYGPGWRCDRGYRAVDEACVAVQVPENAHTDLFGDGWECNRPYRKQQDGCTSPIDGNRCGLRSQTVDAGSERRGAGRDGSLRRKTRGR